ncbi:hypothetical protein HJC23_001030, partial [Cyclotella cryptica]
PKSSRPPAIGRTLHATATVDPQKLLHQQPPHQAIWQKLQHQIRGGVPIITSSEPATSPSRAGKRRQWQSKQERGAEPRLSTKSSASGGAPSTWMDIETAAAIKVQSIYRRNKALKYLEDNGIGRGAHGQNGQDVVRGCAVPFNLFGVGFLFGDATLEDDTNRLEKKRQEKKSRVGIGGSEEVSMRKKSRHLEEVEVVESFEEQEEEQDRELCGSV